MPDTAQGSGNLAPLLAAIEKAVDAGELDEAVTLSRALNLRIRAWHGEPQDIRGLHDAESRVQLLLGRTATLRSELMAQLGDNRRRRRAVQAYQTT